MMSNELRPEGGTFYRAGYEEKGPGDFMPPGWEPKEYGQCSTTLIEACSVCLAAKAAYESWRLNQIKPSNKPETVTYPQAVEVLRNLVRDLPGASMRGFSYGGEWRDRNWLMNVLEVALKGDPK